MKVPLLDLKSQYATLKYEINSALLRVVESQHFILGPQVQELEQRLAAYCSVGHAVGVSSGSDALLLAMMCEGVGAGHEVITSPYTFFATAGAVARVGATPVFVDIKPRTFNLNPDQIEKRITQKTRAIIPVHLFGQATDMDPILAVARKHDLLVIEDAAQAIGASYQGKKVGSLGDYGCFSFFPSKNLGGFGDGGLVTTSSRKRYERLLIFRNHGAEPKYYHEFIGGNFRLDALQAAVLLVKLQYLEQWSDCRRGNAAFYDKAFEGSRVTTPLIKPFARTIYNQYVILVEDRDGLIRHLKKNDIGCEVYYPVPLHLQKCFRYLGYQKGDFPNAEQAAGHSLALPVYPELTGEQKQFVVDRVLEFAG